MDDDQINLHALQSIIDKNNNAGTAANAIPNHITSAKLTDDSSGGGGGMSMDSLMGGDSGGGGDMGGMMGGDSGGSGMDMDGLMDMLGGLFG